MLIFIQRFGGVVQVKELVGLCLPPYHYKPPWKARNTNLTRYDMRRVDISIHARSPEVYIVLPRRLVGG